MRLVTRCFLTLGLLVWLVPLAYAQPKLIIDTADGLPVEIEIMGVYREEVSVRYTASKRVAKLELFKLSIDTQKKIKEVADEARKQVKTLAFNAKLEENASSKPIELVQRGSLQFEAPALTSFRTTRPAEPAAAAPAANEPIKRQLPPGSRTLRLSSSTNLGVDVPVTAVIYWYTQPQGSSVWGLGTSEEVKLNVTQAMMEYIANPTSFPRSDYRGYAVIVYNTLSGAIVWKSSSGNAFLQDAEAKFAEKKN